MMIDIPLLASKIALIEKSKKECSSKSSFEDFI
jgi:hypothetical protein